MKRVIKVILMLMATLTAIYAGILVYANTSTDYDSVVYAAFKYESEIPPSEWYTPEQLGIVNIMPQEGGWLQIDVDKKQEPFPLQGAATFLYNNTFYQVSPFWVTPALPESALHWQMPIGGMLGILWVLAGVLYLKGKKTL